MMLLISTLGNVLYNSYTPPDSAFTKYKALVKLMHYAL